jgi:hypothetical protein
MVCFGEIATEGQAMSGSKGARELAEYLAYTTFSGEDVQAQVAELIDSHLEPLLKSVQNVVPTCPCNMCTGKAAQINEWLEKWKPVGSSTEDTAR